MLIATGGNLSSISLPLPGLAWGLANALGNAAMAIIPLALIARWGAFSVNGVAFLISGFVLVPDQTHALNQLPSSMNADGSAVMNTMQQLAGAIGTAVASTLISEFSAANVNAGMQQADAYVAGFSTSMWVFFGMAVCGEILALLMFRFSVKRAQE